VSADHEAILRSAIKGQYHAALAMLREAIERCPDDLWVSDAFANRTWRMAYHTLYYTHLYLHPRFEDFHPWAHHQTRIQNMDEDSSEPELERYFELPHRPPQTGKPYTKAEVLAYWRICDAMVDRMVDALDLASAESGFPWARVPKAEHQFMNIRHIQHHTAQLADRLRNTAGLGLSWVRTANAAG